jgi:hypothetical protein
MHSTFTNAADFRQERDFGNKIAVTFEFLSAHWRPLGKCLVYFVLPAALVMGVGLGLVTNIIFNYSGLLRTNPQASNESLLSPSYFSGLGLTMVGAALAVLMLLSTVYSYVRLVLATGTAPAPAQVGQEIKHRIGRMLGAFVLLFGLYFIVMMAVVGLMAVSTSFGFLFVILFPLIIYVMVPLTLYFPVLWLEDGSLWQALRRSFYLVRGKWWSTFGLIMVTTMIQFMLCILFALPQYAVMFGKIMKIPGLNSDVFGILTQCLYVLGTMFTYVIPLMAVLFQYFNLVERKEGLGLRSLIDSIGQSAAPVAYEQAYRPEEEGEY